MIKKLDHLAIAVHALDEAVRYYETVLGIPCQGREEIPSQKVRAAFFQVGETHIELLEPTSEDSPVSRFLARHGEGVHHVAFQTDDITGQLARAREAGCRLLNDVPVPGAQGKRIAFLHPRSTHGVLTELCSEGEEKE